MSVTPRTSVRSPVRYRVRGAFVASAKAASGWVTIVVSTRRMLPSSTWFTTSTTSVVDTLPSAASRRQ